MLCKGILLYSPQTLRNLSESLASVLEPRLASALVVVVVWSSAFAFDWTNGAASISVEVLSSSSFGSGAGCLTTALPFFFFTTTTGGPAGLLFLAFAFGC